MSSRIRTLVFASLLLLLPGLLPGLCSAQQTLGSITGVVTDPAGAILPGTTGTAVPDQTGLTRVQTSGSNGFYAFQDLPIGTYTLTFSESGFSVERFPGIL